MLDAVGVDQADPPAAVLADHAVGLLVLVAVRQERRDQRAEADLRARVDAQVDRLAHDRRLEDDRARRALRRLALEEALELDARDDGARGAVVLLGAQHDAGARVDRDAVPAVLPLAVAHLELDAGPLADHRRLAGVAQRPGLLEELQVVDAEVAVAVVEALAVVLQDAEQLLLVRRHGRRGDLAHGQAEAALAVRDHVLEVVEVALVRAGCGSACARGASRRTRPRWSSSRCAPGAACWTAGRLRPRPRRSRGPAPPSRDRAPPASRPSSPRRGPARAPG